MSHFFTNIFDFITGQDMKIQKANAGDTIKHKKTGEEFFVLKSSEYGNVLVASNPHYVDFVDVFQFYKVIRKEQP